MSCILLFPGYPGGNPSPEPLSHNATVEKRRNRFFRLSLYPTQNCTTHRMNTYRKANGTDSQTLIICKK